MAMPAHFVTSHPCKGALLNSVMPANFINRIKEPTCMQTTHAIHQAGLWLKVLAQNLNLPGRWCPWRR